MILTLVIFIVFVLYCLLGIAVLALLERQYNNGLLAALSVFLWPLVFVMRVIAVGIETFKTLLVKKEK